MPLHIVLLTSHFEALNESDRGSLNSDFARYLVKTGCKVTLFFTKILYAPALTEWHHNVKHEFSLLNINVVFPLDQGSQGPYPHQVAAAVSDFLSNNEFDEALFLDSVGDAHFASTLASLAHKLFNLTDASKITRVMLGLESIATAEDILIHELETGPASKIQSIGFDCGLAETPSRYSLDHVYRPLEIIEKTDSVSVFKSSSSHYLSLWNNFRASSDLSQTIDELSNREEFSRCTSKIIFLDDLHLFRSLILRAIKNGQSIALPIQPWALKWKALFPEQIELFETTVNGIRTILGLPVTEIATRANHLSVEIARAPLISVCLTHKDRPNYLDQALASLDAQSTRNFEVILIDDGSVSETAVHYLNSLDLEKFKFPLKVFFLDNGYLGRARNVAASASLGDYLLFMDDDNVAATNEIEAFLSRIEAEDKPDLITCQFRVFSEGQNLDEKLPVSLMAGTDNNFLPFGNWSSDANFCVKRSVFISSGGFTEDYGIGHEDWEFLTKLASLKAVRSAHINEALYYYRVSRTGMLSTTQSLAHYRHLRPLQKSPGFAEKLIIYCLVTRKTSHT